MANNKTLELSIKIAGKMDKSLLAALNGSQNQISSFARSISSIGTAGLAAMGTLATATVATIASCTKEAEKFENYMADVVKYVDGLADATGKISDKVADNGKTYAQNYEAMKDAIKDLSTQIPYTQEDLTRLAAAAGQSGKSMEDLLKIAASGNVTGFLRDIAMTGTAMDISADQAGNWAAKWEKSLKMTHEEVMVLFDQINYLGANSATTAAEIAEAVNSAASLGQVGGVSAATTAALADAMLATGVSTDRVGTSIKRMIVNLSKGASATKVQKEQFEELGMSAEWVAKAMQEDSVGTLDTIFKAINDLPQERQVAALSTLFGQWAIEGGAKIVNNLDVYRKALEMVSDPSLYTGSMEREFNIKSQTPEAIDTMLKNTKTALKIEIGDAFLPAKKQFNLSMIDFLNNIRKNMPELTQLAESLGTLASRGVEKLGNAMDTALPHIQDGINYLLNNGEKVASTLKTLAGVFVAMKFAPAAVRLGGLLFGKGGNSAGTGLGRLIGMGGLFGRGGIIDAARTGAAMANNSMTTGPGELLVDGRAATLGQKLYNNTIGGIMGIFNRGKLFASGASNAEAWGNIVGVSSKIAGAKAFFPSIANALGSGATTMAGAGAVGAGSVLGGIGGALGIGSGILDLIQGAKTTGKEAKDNYFSGGTKIGMVGAGAAAGAGIGALFGGVGAVPGALIGAGIGGIGALFKGSALGKALSDATEEGRWISNLKNNISSFFTIGIPTWWNGVTTQVTTFFTQTIPEKWKEFWNGVGNFITQTVPYAIGYAAGTAQIFFTQTIPEKWNAMWTAIGNFFTVTLPTWASSTWSNNIVPFFTQTIPEKWNAMWTAIGNFFTVTIPTWASSTWSNNIVPFFTQAIPQFFKDLWSSITGFFGKTLPSIASSIWASIKSFFTETIPGFFSNLWSSIKGNVSAGYSAATGGIQPHATGGIFASPHVGLVAEAGPESIIPLSAGNRSRGIDLWMKTGQMLGVKPVELAEIDGGGSGGGGDMTFAPVINIQGSADRSVVEETLAEAQARFEAWYLQMQRRQVRTAY